MRWYRGVHAAGTALDPPRRQRRIRRRPARRADRRPGTVLLARRPARRPRPSARLPARAHRPCAGRPDQSRQGLRPDPAPRRGGRSLPGHGRASRHQGAAAPVSSAPNRSRRLRPIMSAPLTTSRPPADDHAAPHGSANAALAASVLGFFVITLDALVVNVALPDIHKDLGGGISALQWVIDGYTLMFAALLLSGGSLADRIGAHRAVGLGMTVFVLASAGCGLAPGIGVLVAARLVQGTGAALMMPSSLTVIREAFP